MKCIEPVNLQQSDSGSSNNFNSFRYVPALVAGTNLSIYLTLYQRFSKSRSYERWCERERECDQFHGHERARKHIQTQTSAIFWANCIAYLSKWAKKMSVTSAHSWAWKIASGITRTNISRWARAQQILTSALKLCCSPSRPVNLLVNLAALLRWLTWSWAELPR